jgi:hypothetical protein
MRGAKGRREQALGHGALEVVRHGQAGEVEQQGADVEHRDAIARFLMRERRTRRQEDAGRVMRAAELVELEQLRDAERAPVEADGAVGPGRKQGLVVRTCEHVGVGGAIKLDAEPAQQDLAQHPLPHAQRKRALFAGRS